MDRLEGVKNFNPWTWYSLGVVETIDIFALCQATNVSLWVVAQNFIMEKRFDSINGKICCEETKVKYFGHQFKFFPPPEKVC